MSMIRKLISAWMLTLVGSLLLPLVSIAAVSGTTTPATIAEHAVAVRAVPPSATSLQSMAFGQAQLPFALSHSLVAPKTPALSPKVAATFEGTPTYGPVNQVLYRAEDAVNSTTYGRWYGLAAPDSAATAEQMYNVFQYGNNLTELSTYKALPNAMGWVGKVKGGTGYQVYFDVPRANVSLQGTVPLPQAGF